MNIVVLDGYALDPGDNPWDEVAELGNLVVYARTGSKLVDRRIADAEIVLTNKTRITSGTMDRNPQIKYIGVLATGYNIVDVNAAAKRGITVSNVPNYSTDSVAELVFAHMFEICRNVRRHSDSVCTYDWCGAEDYSYWLSPLTELHGKTIGIIGYGTIGARTAEIAHAFGMKVLAYNPRPKEAPGYSDFAFATLEKVLADSDYVSLHCPLFPETQEMINSRTLALMKPTAVLINTSRGQLIDEQALADALNNGCIAGAALDVLSEEPPKDTNPLLTAKNIIITPHIAWATIEARKRLMAITAANIRAFLAGKPQNNVAIMKGKNK